MISFLINTVKENKKKMSKYQFQPKSSKEKVITELSYYKNTQQPISQMNFKDKLQKTQDTESKIINELPLGCVMLDKNYRPTKNIIQKCEKEEEPEKIDLSHFEKLCSKRKTNYIKLYGEDNYNKIFHTKNYSYYF